MGTPKSPIFVFLMSLPTTPFDEIINYIKDSIDIDLQLIPVRTNKVT